MDAISIVIPAYNEEKRIQKTLEQYWQFFSEREAGFEIIVVANNCSDNTASVVRAFSEKHTACRLVVIPRRIGKGGAVKAGFAVTSKKIVGFVDADNSTPPREFLKIVQAVPKADIAVGCRYLPESKILNQPSYRKFLAIGFNFLVNRLFSLRLRDTQCGAKVFSSNAAQVMKQVRSNFFEFDVEVLWKAKRKGFTIQEVPITWTDSRESTVSWRAVPKMFWGILKMRFKNL